MLELCFCAIPLTARESETDMPNETPDNSP